MNSIPMFTVVYSLGILFSCAKCVFLRFIVVAIVAFLPLSQSFPCSFKYGAPMMRQESSTLYRKLHVLHAAYLIFLSTLVSASVPNKDISLADKTHVDTPLLTPYIWKFTMKRENRGLFGLCTASGQHFKSNYDNYVLCIV